MARKAVVYDKGDVVGHYVKGLHVVLNKEIPGGTHIDLLNKYTGVPTSEEKTKIYLIQDVNGRIKGRTLRVYMTMEEVMIWANRQIARNKNMKSSESRVKTLNQAYEALTCGKEYAEYKWFVCDIKYYELSERLRILLKSIKDKHIVVAMRKVGDRITTVVGEQQSKRDGMYGSYVKSSSCTKVDLKEEPKKVLSLKAPGNNKPSFLDVIDDDAIDKLFLGDEDDTSESDDNFNPYEDDLSKHDDGEEDLITDDEDLDSKR